MCSGCWKIGPPSFPFRMRRRLEATSRRSLRQCASLLAAVSALCANPIGAQHYPAKPIRFMVASSAGTGTDVIARLVGNGMTAAMHQQIVLDYRPGAGGNVAAEIVSGYPNRLKVRLERGIVRIQEVSDLCNSRHELPQK